jgi:FAD/FMN-containing dehydrogenase
MSDYAEIKSELKKLVKGEVFDDNETLKKYSRDASLFEVWPKLVIWPKDSEDIQKIVSFVSEKNQWYGR